MKNNIAVEHYAIMETISDLEKLAEIKIGHEDFGSFVKGISSFFTNKIPAIANSFVNNTQRSGKINKDDYNQFVREILENDKLIKTIIGDIKYMNVENIQCPIMLGSRLPLLDTCSALKEANMNITNHFKDALDYADLFISNLISSDDFRQSHGSTSMSFNGKSDAHWYIVSDSSKLDDIIDKIIDPKSFADQKPLKDILPNLSSLDVVKTQLLDIAKGNTLNSIEELNVRIKIIADKTNTLYELLKNNKDIEISKKVAMATADVLDRTARYVTSVCTIWHVINQTATTFKLFVCF